MLPGAVTAAECRKSGIPNDLPRAIDRFLPDVNVLPLVRNCVSILWNDRHRVRSRFYREVAANHYVGYTPFHISERVPAEQTLQERRNCGLPLQHRRTRAKYERVVRIVGQNGCGISACHSLPNPDGGGLDLSPCFGLV